METDPVSLASIVSCAPATTFVPSYQSSRFRNRKINFKSAIPIYIGSLDLPFEDDDYASGSLSALPGGSPAPTSLHNAVPPPGFSINEAGETVRVETGVDKEEEHEHHLQAVISASAAALSRSAGAGSAPSKPLAAHIPTPDATGLVANYTDYYRHGVYQDPHTYIRCSETVEETMGIAYTMDEDDADFLEDYNDGKKENQQPDGQQHPSKQIASSAVSSVDGDASPSTSAPTSPQPAANGFHSGKNGIKADTAKAPQHNQIAIAGHYPPLHPITGLKRSSSRKDKGKDVASPPSYITEDDFELVMDLFERITDRKVPTLHLVSWPVSSSRVL